MRYGMFSGLERRRGFEQETRSFHDQRALDEYKSGRNLGKLCAA